MAQKSSASISPAGKDMIIAQLLVQVAELTARLEKLDAENAALRARVGGLEEKLSQPPKTPDNSSTPPSNDSRDGVNASGPEGIGRDSLEGEAKGAPWRPSSASSKPNGQARFEGQQLPALRLQC